MTARSTQGAGEKLRLVRERMAPGANLSEI